MRKRVLNASGDTEEATNDSGHIDTPRPPKRTKLEMEQLLEAKSSHSHLIDEFEAEQSEQYFSKLERKEQMETKMLDTFEIKTTAVTCSKVSTSYLILNFLKIL